MRVDEEEGEEFAMAWAGGVLEAEGGDAMLEDVGEGEEAVLTGGDAAEFLDCGAVLADVVNLFEAFVIILRLCCQCEVQRYAIKFK